jgi:peptide/nickel transport system substrate-binding protein
MPNSAILKRFKLPSLRRRARTALAAAGVAAVAIGLGACSQPAEEAGPRSLTIGVNQFFGQFPPPYTGFLLTFGIMATYEPLVTYDSVANKWDPYLAKEVTLSEDRKKMTIVLREDVHFSDGTLLDAEGAKAVFEAMVFDDEHYVKPTVEAAGLEITVIDDYTLEITTDIAISDALPLGTGLPSPAVYLDPEKRDTLTENPVGTGPYLLEESVPEQSETYVRNPDYWNPDAVPFESITIKLFSDPVAVLNALKSGQIDAGQIPPEYVAEAESADLSVFRGIANASNVFVIFDTAGEIVPALADVRVRQAMALAFDRSTILEQTQAGLGDDSSQVFAEGHPGHVEDGDDRYAYDPERARDLMAEAGYADGFDLVIPIPVDTAAAAGQYNKALEPAITTALADIGIRVTFEPTELYNANAEAKVAAGYPAAYVLQGPTQFYVYSTGQGADNWGFMFDDEGRALLKTIVEGTQTESDEAWAEFGERALDEAWFITVSQNADGIWATTPDIGVDQSKGSFAQLDDFYRVDQ